MMGFSALHRQMLLDMHRKPLLWTDRPSLSDFRALETRGLIVVDWRPCPRTGRASYRLTPRGHIAILCVLALGAEGRAA